MRKKCLILPAVLICLFLSACGKSLDMEKLISAPVKEAVIRAGGEETRISDRKIAAEGNVPPRCFRLAGKMYYFYGKKAGFTPEGKDPGTGITACTGEIRIVPAKDGESNFEEAVGARCVLAEDEVYIQIGGEWYETVSEDTMKKTAEEAREKASREAGKTE